MTPLIIFTYCQHYHLTKLAILNALDRIQHDHIIVMYDDLFSEQWTVLGPMLRADMSRHGVAIETIPYSKLSLARHIKVGWIRQQMIKLNMHRIYGSDDYILLDGDTMVLQPVDPKIACHINMNDPPNDDSYNFYDHLLRVNGRRVMYKGKSITFSSVPLKYVRSSTLKGLEQLVKELHGKTIYEVYEIMRSRTHRVSFSEFDIIGTYENIVSKDGLPVTHLDVKYSEKDEFIGLYNNTKEYKLLTYVITQGKEILPRSWYEQQGISINDEIWSMLGRKD